IGEPAYWGKGIGTKLVQAAITYIMGEMGAEAIAMDPKVNNERAIKCYEKSGFKKVKILKEHELHEGKLEDCWMMAAWIRHPSVPFSNGWSLGPLCWI
ncbi:GNAT family N-acetyltransferase, partial [Bacillus sp. HC-Mk]